MSTNDSKLNLPAGFSSVAELQAWLLAELARRMRVPSHQLQATEPLANLGLDSRTAVAISGDLERIFGRELSPTLVWDYPTVEALATHLMDEQPASAPGVAT